MSILYASSYKLSKINFLLVYNMTTFYSEIPKSLNMDILSETLSDYAVESDNGGLSASDDIAGSFGSEGNSDDNGSTGSDTESSLAAGNIKAFILKILK